MFENLGKLFFIGAGLAITAGVAALGYFCFFKNAGIKRENRDNLSFEDVVNYFKNDNIKSILASSPNLTAVALNKPELGKNIITLCIFDKTTNSIVNADLAVNYVVTTLSSDLIRAFNGKEMLVLK